MSEDGDHQVEAAAGGEHARLVMTAWHLRRMRSMPRAFYLVRRLDRATRGDADCLWIHRWISRRSLMLTSTWATEADANRWLGSDRFRRTAASLDAIEGTVARIQVYRAGASPSSGD